MSFEPSDFQLADAVREQREARPESSVKFLQEAISSSTTANPAVGGVGRLRAGTWEGRLPRSSVAVATAPPGRLAETKLAARVAESRLAIAEGGLGALDEEVMFGGNSCCSVPVAGLLLMNFFNRVSESVQFGYLSLITLLKTVSEKLVQMESALTSGLEVGGATSVDKLPSLDTLIASSAKADHVSIPLHDSGVRISAPVSLQQPTIADVQAAPNPEVASQKGISDGGLVKVSDKAKIINRDPNSKFQVLRTAPPPGISASASFTLSVAVLEDQKFNPASYSDFVIREPGRPEMRVPVLSRLLQFTRLQVS